MAVNRVNRSNREEPGPGQESVWDDPRPPRVENHSGVVVIEFGGQEIARSSSARRVLETSHPPVFYVPLADFAPDALRPVEGTTWCEYKGAASYYDVVAGTPALSGPPGPTFSPPRAMKALPVPSRCIRAGWTGASSTARKCRPNPATSTAAGSPPAWSARSKARRAPGAGSRS